MLKDISKYKRLVIVGNGFDLAHNLKTKYEDFAEKSKDKSVKQFKNEVENKLKNDGQIKSWYLFEERIKNLTDQYFKDEPLDQCNLEFWTGKNQLFKRVELQLKDYLKEIVQSSTYDIKKSVSKYFDDDTFTLNFNYTNTVESYTKDVFYVHGSLEEDEIILGYDNRVESDLKHPKQKYYNKLFLRKELRFKRYVQETLGVSSGERLYKQYIEEYQRLSEIDRTGKGLEQEDWEKIKNKDVKKVLEKYWEMDQEKNKLFDLPELDFKDIEEVVIMGHGIESDQQLLKVLFERISKLSRIVIFTFKGEDRTEFLKKVNFLQQYCCNIKEELY